jgi:hypothetical protein
VLTLDPGGEAIQHSALAPAADANPRLSGADVDGVTDPAKHRAAWGRWAGREREFYQASARLVEGLTWNDVVCVAGAEVQLAAALVRKKHAAIGSHALPDRVRMGAVETATAGAKFVQVTGYSAWDPLVIPRALGDVLHFFDGRSPRAALAAVAAETGLEIEPAVVRRLVDFEVLVAEPEPPRKVTRS